MKISTKGRYGIKAAMDLAIHKEEGVIPLKTIAERQKISENYLEQLLAMLRKKDIVKSVRGAHGGYFLSREISEISVGDIIRALEGPIAPVECVLDDDEKYCSGEDRCVTKTIWKKIRDSVNEVIDSISLRDLVEEYGKFNISNEMMYYI